MSVYLYDEALVERLRRISGDDRIRVISPDNAILFLAQFDKDKDKLPAIIVSRTGVTINHQLRNQVAILRGQSSRLNEDNTASKMKNIPLRIEWNIDVYAVDRFTCDEIIRELVFYLYSYPRFSIKVPYDIDVEQNFDVFLEPEIADNSDLIEFPNRGEFFRETLSIYTENAHMFSSGKIYLTKASVVTEIAKPGEDKHNIINNKEMNTNA